MHGSAEVVFWACIGLLFYAYAGYPLFLGLIALFFPSRRAAALPDAELPSLSLIIAAHNEAAGIGLKLAQSLALDYPPELLELVVASDASTDGTDEIVGSFADAPAGKGAGPRPALRLLRVAERRGKTHAQNEAVKAARGEILVFSDATTRYEPRALRWLAANYRDARVGAVSGRLIFHDPLRGSPTGAGTVAFWSYENWVKRFQWRIRTLTGCTGCIYSVRANCYTPLPENKSSDLVEPLCVVRRGYQVAFEPRAVAYEETTETARQEFRMRVRVITGGILGMLSVPELLKPWRRPWISLQLLSHKVTRWSVGWLLLALFAGNLALLHRPLYRWTLAAQLTFYLLALAGLRWPLQRWWKPLGIPLYFCTLNAAAVVSCVEILRGRDHALWTPVRRQA